MSINQQYQNKSQMISTILDYKFELNQESTFNRHVTSSFSHKKIQTLLLFFADIYRTNKFHLKCRGGEAG